MSKIFPKIHNEGYKFVIIFVIATIILYFINGFLGFIGPDKTKKSIYEIKNYSCDYKNNDEFVSFIVYFWKYFTHDNPIIDNFGLICIQKE